MTNGSSDRIEDDLETVKDILITVARRAEATDQRLDRLTDNVTQLGVRMDQLGVRMDQLATEAREDRVVMHEVIDQLVSLREENQQILNYLFGQQRNGHGDQPQ